MAPPSTTPAVVIFMPLIAIGLMKMPLAQVSRYCGNANVRRSDA
jgi:hypothetical protein